MSRAPKQEKGTGRRPALLLKLDPQLRCLLSYLRFGAHDEGGNMGDTATVLDPVAKRERVHLGPRFAGIELRLFGHAIHPNSRALSFAILHA